MNDLTVFEQYVNSIPDEPADAILARLLAERDEREQADDARRLVDAVAWNNYEPRPVVDWPVTMVNGAQEWDDTDRLLCLAIPAGAIVVAGMLIILAWLVVW